MAGCVKLIIALLISEHHHDHRPFNEAYEHTEGDTYSTNMVELDGVCVHVVSSCENHDLFGI